MGNQRVNEELAGQLLRDRRDDIAVAAVTRQYRLQETKWARYGAAGREKSDRDMGYHIDYLVEALSMSDPSLFTEYVGWAKVLFSNLGFTDDALTTTLSCLREAIMESLPERASAAALRYLDVGLAHASAAPRELPSMVDVDGPHGDLALAYLQALLRGDRHDASRLVLDAVEDGMDVRDVYIEVFQATQREIGRLWQVNEISVAQEHYCTAATQLVMSQLYPHIFSTERKGKRMVATCVGGELHEMGMRMVADFFEMAGWDTYYLGANTPMSAILSTLEAHDVDVLGVSATMTFHIQRVVDLISAVRRSDSGGHVKVLVGGYPFLIAPELWRHVGADGSAPDARQAVATAEDLVGVRR